jgi:hypothetical protein
MKRRTVVWLVALSLGGIVACEETAETDPVDNEAIAPAPADEKAPAGERQRAGEQAGEAEPGAPGPADVCGEIVEAAKAKDEGKLLALCTPGSADSLAAADKEAVFTAIAASACGAATAEGGKATVAVTAGEKAMELPFTKVADAWKLDTAAYLEKYPPAKAEGGKKKKKATKKKAKHQPPPKKKKKKAKKEM